MTKKKQEDQKEQEIEKLSEWQKRNKEYLEKKAQEEAEKEKELAEQKKQHLPNSEKKKVEKNDESAEEVTADTQENESEEAEKPTETETSEEGQDKPLDKTDLRKKKKAERKQAKQNEKETREKIAPRHVYRALPVLILSSVLLILAVYFISPYSKLKNIEVTGNKQLSKTEVLEASSIQKEDYTLTTYLSQKAHAKNIKQSNLWVEKAEITYRFPITFKIKVAEYKVVAYDYSGEQYFPVLSSGEEIANPVTKSQLPKSYIRLDFSDKAMLKKFVRQLAGISDTIKSEIQTVQHTPSKVTEDLLTLMMTDGNKIIVPLSEVAKKLPYYEKIKPQLTEASIVDMEAGIFSYRIS